MHTLVVRYILAGVLNTVVYYMLYALFYTLSSSVVFGVIAASGLGILFSFYSFKYGVFQRRSRPGGLLLFYLLYGVTTSINMASAWIFNTLLLFNGYIAGALASAIAAIVSYLVNRYYIFKGDT